MELPVSLAPELEPTQYRPVLKGFETLELDVGGDSVAPHYAVPPRFEGV